MKITLTGSLGNIGKPLTTQLVEKGHTVTVISSSSQKQKDIEALGALARIGSVEDATFLTAAFKNADAVFAMIPPNFTTTDAIGYYQTVGHCYAQAITAANVKRVVHLSSWGAHLAEGTGFIAGSHDVEQILDAIPEVAVTHLRPGSFYTNLFHFEDMIRHAGFIGSNYGGEDKVVMVAPADIADVAAEELTSEEHEDKICYVGSVDVTANHAAKVIGLAIGKPELKWVTFTDEQTQEALEKAGMPTKTAALMVELGASIHNGTLREDYDLHPPEQLGKVTLEDFAKEFASVYQSK